MCAFAPRDASFIKARDVIAAACPLPENDIICLSGCLVVSEVTNEGVLG